MVGRTPASAAAVPAEAARLNCVGVSGRAGLTLPLTLLRLPLPLPPPPFESVTQMLLDRELHLAAWGPDLTVAFPSAADADAFASGLARVAVQPCSLADSPAAAAVAMAAAEAALCGAAAACKAEPGSCPQSPSPAEQPLSGGKRKADVADLQTPLVRVSVGPAAAMRQQGCRLAAAGACRWPAWRLPAPGAAPRQPPTASHPACPTHPPLTCSP